MVSNRGPLSEDELFKGYASTKEELIERLMTDPKFEGIRLRDGAMVTLQLVVEDDRIVSASIIAVEYAEE